ncbi:hypothetical protein BN7_412 [Wickerhamomyces ciferrii]|uniref:Secreted protein n=1 Tax=Wickerhamomyces ciferrii (strain ATCC 14091 / BCRC 22168 / CBS 111 / JCM 3599 / NBRC 0793 / NRRL Y-1031 F-60-10) TaxID=1206466 RepID=K0KIA3_WICCF|nr:uncharacterized protein BN7_412 [Wickerhamomyces ciferrii]CCH40878.1 hypothetical protein BN7_412 [Wickerhamomyces ciferrii]
MQFSKVLGASAIAAVASAQYANVTSTAEVYSNQTTVITVTSCEENKCTEVPVTTGVTVVTSTVDNVVTEYTTYCPLSTSEAPAPSSQAPKTTSAAPKDTTSTANVDVTSTVGNATTPGVSTQEANGAAKAVPAVAAIAAGVALLF